MGELVVELIIQVLFEVVGEALIDLGFHGTARVLRSKIGRAVVSALLGFGFGVWWGWHLAEQGTADRPRLFWVSVALAVVAAVVAFRRAGARSPAGNESLAHFVVPWRWPADRLAAFAVLNAAIAAGIATGWHPPVLA